MKNLPTRRSPGFFQAAKTIFWAFIGVRRRKHGESDVASLRPAQIVVAGLVGGALLVLVLLLVVRVVVMGHGAST